LLAEDPAYAGKARRVSQLSQDLAEVLLVADLSALSLHNPAQRVAVHAPCTLRNALGQPDLIQRVLARAGFDIVETAGNSLCCGSAGSYSILQPDTSVRLREQTLRALTGDRPDVIATANIGCQLHLQSGAAVRVVHWIELLDEKKAAAGGSQRGNREAGN
jgi:glycolate oxidase iron-sulfur subunit